MQEVQKLGAAGQVVTVKDGYARNFLIPRGLALPATGSHRARIQAELARKTAHLESQKAKAVELQQRLAATLCTLACPVGAQDKLHGAVTSQDIVDQLARDGISLDRQQLILERPITRLGDYSVEVKLHPEVTATVQVRVVPSTRAPTPDKSSRAPKGREI